MKRRTRPDPVSQELHAAVIARDGGCVGAKLGAPGACRNWWGYPPSRMDFELDHVKRDPRMGKRAESTMGTLVQLCHFHHQGGWATANRPALREYLASVNEKREAA